MNIAITDGLQLMPPAFRAGLSVWSQAHGTPGSPTWAAAPNAALVPADQDFGTCLEINKTASTTRIRFMGETPMFPGVYLRISARVKALAGPLPSVRVGSWACDRRGNNIPGVRQITDATAVPGYGEIIEVSAIVGVGERNGVDLSWGPQASYGYFGIDLIGPNGGSVRIESIRIEDVTSAFIPELIDWVDVRDFGAKGDGTTNDFDAFVAADNASRGGSILVPEGTFRINDDLQINSPIRFMGKITAPASARIVFLQSFDFATYADAFGDETLGLKKALQALFGYNDHCTLDLCGRRIDLTEPIVISEAAPGLQNFFTKRSIFNGELRAVPGAAWNTRAVTSQGSYDVADPDLLTNVGNVAAIEIGSRVIGNGVGREVYVTDRNVAQRTLTLSQPLHGGSGTRSYRFERYRYLLDFALVQQIQHFSLNEIVFNCSRQASAVMLPRLGGLFSFRECNFEEPKDRGITSIGRGCQGMRVDECDFRSGEAQLLAHQRSSVAININANDAKIRNSRFSRFAHFLVANGGGHIISGNHWFQGDSAAEGLRTAGLVLTNVNPMITISGNYIDNASIEWTNEHQHRPTFTGGAYSFGALTIIDNCFLSDHTVPWFSWIVIKPFGSGHFIHGLNVSGNVFKSLYNKVDRVERVDTSYADLNYGRSRNIRFTGNSFTGVTTFVENPLTVRHRQSTAAATWTLPPISGLPFESWARRAQAVVLTSPLIQGNGARVSKMPWVQAEIGATRRQLRLHWDAAVRGDVSVQVAMDNPD